MMKHVSLFSNKRSVLNYWQKHIYQKYTLLSYDKLPELYKELERAQPDVILCDYDGDPAIAEELLEYVESKKARTYIMVLNSRPLFPEGIRLLRKGARAFMNAYAKPENLNQAIEAVLEGNIWLYTEFIQAMIKQSLFSQVEESDLMQQLSSREREITQFVALGMSNKEIAQHADITEQTVKTHLKTIYEKLGVSTRLELAIMINRIDNSY
jgi:DNA-binding NarL/FixJ family response regulator